MRSAVGDNRRGFSFARLWATLIGRRFNTFLYLVIIGILGTCVSYTMPLLVEASTVSSSALDAHERFTLSSLSHLMLANGNRSQLVDYLKETTRLAHIHGIAILDPESEVIVSVWKGEERVFDPATKTGNWVYWPVQDGAQFTAYVSAVFDDYSSDPLVGTFSDPTAIAVSCLVFLLLIGAWISWIALARRIKAISRATVRITEGDFSVRISPTGSDVIAELGRAFDGMAQALERYMAELRAVEKDRAQVTLHSIADGVITTDKNARVDYMNPAAEKLVGLAARYAKGVDLLTVFDVRDVRRRTVRTEAMKRALKHGKSARFAEQPMLRNARGVLNFIEESVAPLRDRNGEISGIVMVFHNVTERRALRAALERERERALVTLDSIGEGVITTDVANRVVYMNSAAEQLTGYLRSEARNQPIGKVVTILDEFEASPADEPTGSVLLQEQGRSDLHEAVLLSRTGERYIVEHNATPLCDRLKRVIGSVLVFHNVTDRHEMIQVLSHQARHDSLTQLINRYEFERHLEQAVVSAAEDESIQHVICYMDLDQFKVVNDACGHSAGDELLRQIATLLRKHVRKSDTLARLGGDEFGLLLPFCPLGKALEVAESVRRSVEDFRFVWQDRTFSIGVSIGVLPVNGDTTELAGIFSAVDEACYIAKHKGRNQVHVYQHEDQESSDWHSEIQWVPHIRQALDESRFVLFAQPIVPVDPERKEKGHYEILLRMKDNHGRIVGPGSFLPAAERYGLMPIVDRWVVDNAIEAVSTAWHQEGPLAIDTFGINISGGVLSDDNFLDHIKSALDSHGLPPELLCFEITETLAIANFSLAGHFVGELKKMGCRFALDDFGSGFASFRNLKGLAVDYLKIDGSFVRHMLENPADYAMAEVINRLGHIMGLQTIAEFVESQDILEALRRVGVDYAQGYHIGRPQPLYEVCYSGIDCAGFGG